MKKLLLHICCAPDQTVAHERTSDEYKVTGYFSNSCIEPKGEYFKRLAEAKRLAEIQGMDLLEDEYFPNSFLAISRGLEKEPEKGKRCNKCIEYRMRRTAERAAEEGFDIFATTLTVSPHKDADYINRLGIELAEEFDIEYLQTNFKKQDGFKRSVELSKKLGIFRQNYCGCRYSLRDKKKRDAEKEDDLNKVVKKDLDSMNEGYTVSEINKHNLNVPPGAFYKPVENLSRRFNKSKKK